jgi:mRNA interferase RelE/StbE
MSYQFTFTSRFQKHFKSLTEQEKKQLMNKLKLLAENPMHPSFYFLAAISCANFW